MNISFKRIIISSISIVCILLGVLQFPGLFIQKRIAYKAFEVYSNDDIDLDDDVKNILDAVLSNLKESQFYEPKQVFELYFVQETLYEKLIGLFGTKNIASSKFNKHIYIGKPDFKGNILGKADSKYEWLNLVQIITHEGVHSQMYGDYSTLGFMQTPSWINEGYCEYISYRPIRNHSDYKLSDLVNKYENNDEAWMKTEYECMTPKQYVRDRILIEFLIDDKQMNIKQIIDDESLVPDKIYEEIILL